MKEKRKIAVITGTRAEYGLLQGLMTEINNDPDLILQVVATGMHLSPEFGLTYQFIEEDGFTLDEKVEMLLSSDTAIGTAKSIALGVIGFTDAFSKLNPDIIVLLGDRFESLAAAQTALVQKIPIAHIHGGELSAGAIDDAIRHSISKMSHLHFVAAEPYRQRVIQLGEHPTKVFNVGAPGLERISKVKLLSQAQLEKSLNFKFGETNFLVCYHPTTLESEKNVSTLESIFAALNHFPKTNIIFTKANADEAGRAINLKIDEYVAQHPERCAAYVTLGDVRYLSLLQYVDMVIGNSSSGLIEVPWFRKPTINIGNRQLNRLRADSVIDCTGETNAILNAIKLANAPEFKIKLNELKLPYSQDQTAFKIKTIIKEADLQGLLLKQFYDVTEKVMA